MKIAFTVQFTFMFFQKLHLSRLTFGEQEVSLYILCDKAPFSFSYEVIFHGYGNRDDCIRGMSYGFIGSCCTCVVCTSCATWRSSLKERYIVTNVGRCNLVICFYHLTF